MAIVSDVVSLDLQFPKDIFLNLQSLGFSKEGIKEEVKISTSIDLFKRKLLSLGKAAELANMCTADFIDILGKNKIPLHYTKEDFEEDLITVSKLVKLTKK